MHSTAGRLTSKARSWWELRCQCPCIQRAGVSPLMCAGPVLFDTSTDSNGTRHDTPSRAGVAGDSHRHRAFCVVGKTRELPHQQKVNIIFCVWENWESLTILERQHWSQRIFFPREVSSEVRARVGVTVRWYILAYSSTLCSGHCSAQRALLSETFSRMCLF